MLNISILSVTAT